MKQESEGTQSGYSCSWESINKTLVIKRYHDLISKDKTTGSIQSGRENESKTTPFGFFASNVKSVAFAVSRQ
jgi:hypothetical protein